MLLVACVVDRESSCWLDQQTRRTPSSRRASMAWRSAANEGTVVFDLGAARRLSLATWETRRASPRPAAGSCRRTAATAARGRSSSSRRRTGSPSLNVIGVESKKIKAVRAVARLSPARNPLAYHSDYFGACAVGANGAPRPFLRCRAARGPPGSSAAWRRRFTRAARGSSLGTRQKKRSRPGNCARRRRLLKALKATPAPAFYLLVSYGR